jgi:hypothetical protein
MNAAQREVRDIINEVAKKTGFSPEIIECIYMHEFEFIAKQIAMGERNDPDTFENILVKKLGSFFANRKHILKLKSIEDAKKDKYVKDSV